MTDVHPEPTGPEDGAPAQQHGDPLLDAAQGRGDGADGSRHGHDATGSVPPPSEDG